MRYIRSVHSCCNDPSALSLSCPLVVGNEVSLPPARPGTCRCCASPGRRPTLFSGEGGSSRPNPQMGRTEVAAGAAQHPSNARPPAGTYGLGLMANERMDCWWKKPRTRRRQPAALAGGTQRAAALANAPTKRRRTGGPWPWPPVNKRPNRVPPYWRCSGWRTGSRVRSTRNAGCCRSIPRAARTLQNSAEAVVLLSGREGGLSAAEKAPPWRPASPCDAGPAGLRAETAPLGPSRLA